MIFKLSAVVLSAMGVKTAEEFDAAFGKFITDTKATATAHAEALETIAALEESHGTLAAGLKKANETISAQATTITALETKLGNPATLTESKIIELATAKGSEAAIAAVAGAAAGSPTAAAPTAAVQTEPVKALIAAGKFEEAYALDPVAKKEHPTAKSYAAYMRASAGGQIRIVQSARE